MSAIWLTGIRRREKRPPRSTSAVAAAVEDRGDVDEDGRNDNDNVHEAGDVDGSPGAERPQPAQLGA